MVTLAIQAERVRIYWVLQSNGEVPYRSQMLVGVVSSCKAHVMSLCGAPALVRIIHEYLIISWFLSFSKMIELITRVLIVTGQKPFEVPVVLVIFSAAISGTCLR